MEGIIMRLSHLLFEARDLLGSKELQQLFIDIELKYKIKPEQAVALVNQVDPRNKYAKWILQRIEDGSLKPDKKEISEYAEAIRQMEHTNQSNRARGISAINIMQFKTLSDLQNAINLTPIAQKKGYIKDPTKLKGVEFIGKIEGIEAYKVTDPHSLNEMGIGTKWCTRKDYKDGDENPFLTATDCIKDDGFVYVFRENGYPIIQASKNFDMFTDINNKEIKRNFVYNIAKQLGILGETIAFIIPRLSKKFISKLTFSDESILSLIVKNPKVVKYFDNLSDKVQVEATKKGCFKYLRNPSEAAQIQAVSQAAHYIDLIENPSERVQLALVSNYGICIKDLIEKGIVPSERVQLAAVQQDGNVIYWIKNPSEEVQLAAVQQYGFAIQFIKNPSERVKAAARAKGWKG